MKLAANRSRISIKVGGLDLSRSCIDHVSIESLDRRDFLDTLKNDILTNHDKVNVINSHFVSIFIFVSIKTLDLDTLKKDISTCWDISILIWTGCDCWDFKFNFNFQTKFLRIHISTFGSNLWKLSKNWTWPWNCSVWCPVGDHLGQDL
jgi:hypothetical protein